MATDNNNNALNNRLKRNLKLLLFGMSFPVVRSHWKTLDDNKRGGKKKDFARMKTIFEWVIIIFLYSVRRGGKFDFETSATMRKRMQQETLPIRKNNCKISNFSRLLKKKFFPPFFLPFFSILFFFIHFDFDRLSGSKI